MNVSDSEFFPTVSDQQHLREEFALLVSRVVVEYIDAFASFSQFVVKHAAHDRAVEAARKSEQHRLGLDLLELNEIKQQDMVDILRFLNSQYVPY